MFGFEKSTKGPLSGLPQDVAEAIREAGLENDPAVLQMIESDFVSPNGTEQDPLTFIKERKQLVEAGDTGTSAPEIREDGLVQHSKDPELEHGSLSQQ
jgi:hypothetical protein